MFLKQYVIILTLALRRPSVDLRINSLMIFITFFKVSALTIGGGYAMVPVLIRHLDKKGWLGQKEFYNFLARAQSVPGPIAFNLSIMIGKEVGGLKGSIAGAIGVIIPPFFTIMLIGAFLTHFSNSILIKGFLKGAFGAILGLIGGVLYKMIQTKRWNYFEVLIMIAGALALVFESSYAIFLFVMIVIAVYVGDKKWGS